MHGNTNSRRNYIVSCKNTHESENAVKVLLNFLYFQIVTAQPQYELEVVDLISDLLYNLDFVIEEQMKFTDCRHMSSSVQSWSLAFRLFILLLTGGNWMSNNLQRMEFYTKTYGQIDEENLCAGMGKVYGRLTST